MQKIHTLPLSSYFENSLFCVVTNRKNGEMDSEQKSGDGDLHFPFLDLHSDLRPSY